MTHCIVAWEKVNNERIGNSFYRITRLNSYSSQRSLADRLHATGEVNDCRALLSSPVLRARQTAEVLANRLAIGPVEQDCDLCELHPGEADGLSWEDYQVRYGANVSRQVNNQQDWILTRA